MKKLLTSLILCLIMFLGGSAWGGSLDDFEGSFVSTPPYGSIPTGWTAAGSTLVNYSQSTDAYEGSYSLRARVSYDSMYYAAIERTFSGFHPGDIVDIEIRVKCSTTYRAEAGLAIQQGSATHSQVLFWYSSSSEWRSARLEDIIIGPDGDLNLNLKMGNDGDISYFYWDALIYEEEPLGSIKVNLEPPEALSAGAQWNVDGGEWQDSGTIVSDLSVGSHLVNYKPISDWVAPRGETVAISKDQVTELTRFYKKSKPMPWIPLLLLDENNESLQPNSCGEGLPLTLSVLSFPEKVTAGSSYDGSVTFRGGFEDIENPRVFSRIPYLGGFEISRSDSAPSVSNCSMDFSIRIPDDLVGTGKIYFKLIDYDDSVDVLLNWANNAVSNEISQNITIQQ